MAFAKYHATVLSGEANHPGRDISDARASSRLARNRRGEVGKGGTDSMGICTTASKQSPSTETFIRLATLFAVNVSVDSLRSCTFARPPMSFVEGQQQQQHSYAM